MTTNNFYNASINASNDVMTFEKDNKYNGTYVYKFIKKDKDLYVLENSIGAPLLEMNCNTINPKEGYILFFGDKTFMDINRHFCYYLKEAYRQKFLVLNYRSYRIYYGKKVFEDSKVVLTDIFFNGERNIFK